MTIIMVAPIESLGDSLFGFGINQVTGQRVALSCVKQLPAPVVSIPAGNGDQLSMLIVQDEQSYSQLMSTVASLSASGISWSASASVSFLREQASSDTAITLTWTRVVRTQDRMVDWTKARISTEALQLLTSQGADAFIERYGTHCIIGIAYGGSFSGYARIETQSTQDKETLKTAISGSMSGFGVSGTVSADFEQAMQSAHVEITSSQDTSAVGANPIVFTSLDIDGMNNAVRSFAPSANTPLPGVSGAPIALICVSWDQFADIAGALNGDTSSIDLMAQGNTLSSLSAEYAALSYVIGTADRLQGSNAIIAAYVPLLGQIAQTANQCRTQIASLTIDQIRGYAATGTASFMQSAVLKPQIDRIAAGLGQIEVSYALDGEFGNPAPTGTVTHLMQPGGGEQTDLGSFIHARAEGSDQGDQILTLRYIFDRDANGIPFIGARLHYQDPYAPPETQQQDFGNGRVLLNQSETLTYTAAWPEYPWNKVTITLVPPTG